MLYMPRKNSERKARLQACYNLSYDWGNVLHEMKMKPDKTPEDIAECLALDLCLRALRQALEHPEDYGPRMNGYGYRRRGERAVVAKPQSSDLV